MHSVIFWHTILLLASWVGLHSVIFFLEIPREMDRYVIKLHLRFFHLFLVDKFSRIIDLDWSLCNLIGNDYLSRWGGPCGSVSPSNLDTNCVACHMILVIIWYTWSKIINSQLIDKLWICKGIRGARANLLETRGRLIIWKILLSATTITYPSRMYLDIF
jgi:hypothetical protein